MTLLTYIDFAIFFSQYYPKLKTSLFNLIVDMLSHFEDLVFWGK